MDRERPIFEKQTQEDGNKIMSRPFRKLRGGARKRATRATHCRHDNSLHVLRLVVDIRRERKLVLVLVLVVVVLLRGRALLRRPTPRGE